MQRTRIKEQKRLSDLHKVEEDPNNPTGICLSPRIIVDTDGSAIAPPVEESSLRPHLYSSPVRSSEETLMGHKLDDMSVLPSPLLRPAPIFSSALAPNSLGGAVPGRSASQPSQSFASAAPFIQGSALTEHILLDEVQFSRHPRPKVTTKMV